MANTTADKLQKALDNKAAIKAAIEAKNPEVMPTDVMSQWPTSIGSIPEGSDDTPEWRKVLDWLQDRLDWWYENTSYGRAYKNDSYPVVAVARELTGDSSDAYEMIGPNQSFYNMWIFYAGSNTYRSTGTGTSEDRFLKNSYDQTQDVDIFGDGRKWRWAIMMYFTPYGRDIKIGYSYTTQSYVGWQYYLIDADCSLTRNTTTTFSSINPGYNGLFNANPHVMAWELADWGEEAGRRENWFIETDMTNNMRYFTSGCVRLQHIPALKFQDGAYPSKLGATGADYMFQYSNLREVDQSWWDFLHAQTSVTTWQYIGQYSALEKAKLTPTASLTATAFSSLFASSGMKELEIDNSGLDTQFTLPNMNRLTSIRFCLTKSVSMSSWPQSASWTVENWRWLAENAKTVTSQTLTLKPIVKTMLTNLAPEVITAFTSKGWSIA